MLFYLGFLPICFHITYITVAPIREYSIMKGYKYGLESCTIVPIIFTLPQLFELLTVELKAVHACGSKPSRYSVSFLVIALPISCVKVSSLAAKNI